MDGKANICILDFSPDDLEILTQKGFSIYNGSAGTRIEIEYSKDSITKYCLPNHNYPKNLHEYDILIVNLIWDDTIPYNVEEHRQQNIFHEGEIKFKVNSPTNIFDPRPYSLNLLSSEIKEFAKKECLLIVFADEIYEEVYQIVKLDELMGPKELNKAKFSNYSFLNVLTMTPKYGFKSKIVAPAGDLKKLLEDFQDLEYHQTFHKYTSWDKEHKTKPDPNYAPLLENYSGEAISFSYTFDHLNFFIFPDINRKGEFTARFLTEVAPQMLPELFSHDPKFDWLNKEDYWLPKHQSFVEQKQSENERHKRELEKIEEAILKNAEEYHFLHELISETDEKLVDAVIKLLNWLGFENVMKFDEAKDDGPFEEDIQIQVDDKLLVIEVKGIGGTSKDSECSQISKIRLRRMKERKTTEVYGLYIVNHERYKPPLQRTNPPFNAFQIQDATYDERGLLSTWELYKVYYDIENGIFTKSEVREMLFKYGLINFRSSLELIGKVDKIYQNGSIGSIDLNGTPIVVGDILYSEKNGRLKTHKVLSLQQNKIPINEAVEGKTGLLFDDPIHNNSFIYRKFQQ